MRLSEFRFELPSELIAQFPPAQREDARLLVHDLASGETQHRKIPDLAELLHENDLLVVNDTRVVPARVFGRRKSGGRVEFLFLEPCSESGADPGRTWTALVNPARKLRVGEIVELAGGAGEARMVRRHRAADGRPAAEWSIELAGAGSSSEILEFLEAHGQVPLPPYIRRDSDVETAELDRERYQTVYARRPGAVAAPTAGLHFTPELLARLDRRGVRRVSVTLHVGAGTFQPIQCEDVEDHDMHAERYELSEEVALAVDETRARGGRVVAVGTTSVRVLESRARTSDAGAGRVRAGSGETRLYLTPGSRFRVVDALVTNFHLPESSLLLLVSAFAGRERILELYAQAIEERYRFFSYGDAMFLYGRSASHRSG